MVLLLGACAHPYDREALPAAALTYHQEIFVCESQPISNATNYSQDTACQVAAERNFAKAIHLVKMDVFEAYAARMMALAADRDLGLLNPEQAQSRVTAIRRDYWVACDCNLTGPRMVYNYGNHGIGIDLPFSSGEGRQGR